MRSGALPVAVWGTGVVAVGLFGHFGFGLELLPTLLLIGAGSGAITVAGLSLAGVVGRTRRPERDEVLEPDVSFPALGVALGLAVAAVGVVAGGQAFLWPGLGLMLLGAVGLTAENLAADREGDG